MTAFATTAQRASAGPILQHADREAVVAAARDAGFDLAGVANVPLPGSAEDLTQQQRFREFVEAGRAGDMAWLTRADAEGNLLRSSLHRAVPWVRSVVVCAMNYNADAPTSTALAPRGAGWIARYAWSGAAGMAGPSGTTDIETTRHELRPTDYHDVLLCRLRRVESVLLARYQDGAVQTRSYVDTGPVVERFFAQLAGVGWIGKNTCVLNQGMGSWLLLGVVLTSLPLEETAALLPAADRCGTCTRCLDACPTDALIAPRQMDASRCIAYLTIEKKGELPEPLRAGMGRQVFGCDICQDVCPWNRRAPVSSDLEMQPRSALVNPALAWLAAMDGPEFNRQFRGSPLERTGRRRVQRNVAIAMGNAGDTQHRPLLEKWAAGEDALLAEAARWALRRMEELSTLTSATEVEAVVQQEPPALRLE